MKKKLERKKFMALLAAILCLTAGLAAGIGLSGRYHHEQIARQEAYHSMQDDLNESAQEASAQSMAESAAESAAEEARREIEESLAAKALPPELTRDQKDLLELLAEYTGSGEYEKAARLMLSQSEALSELYYVTMEEKRYLYSDGKLTKELEGEGLVLARSSLVFFGEFSAGLPEGKCVAFQAVEIDSPRYDYALGEWKAGRMNGEGEEGYCCYEGAGEENRSLTRRGTFKDDRMSGEVLLTTVNAQGEESSWTMQAEDGVLVIDDAWQYDSAQDAYLLPSDGDAAHAYTVSADSISEPYFQNLLLWE